MQVDVQLDAQCIANLAQQVVAVMLVLHLLKFAWAKQTHAGDLQAVQTWRGLLSAQPQNALSVATLQDAEVFAMVSVCYDVAHMVLKRLQGWKQLK